jgi:hypothetical protein
MGCFYVDCVNEPFVHGLTRREAGQAEIPNELNAGAILPATRDSVNAIYYQIKNTQNGGTFLYLSVSCSANRPFKLQKRSQLFVGAHNETFSVVPMCVCNPDWSPIAIHSKPDRPKRQGRFTGLSAFSTDICQTRELLSRTRRELYWRVRARTAAQCTYWKFRECALIR